MSLKVKSLELRDSVLKNLVSDFQDYTGRTYEQVRYRFDDCKGRSCQGLILIHKRKSKKKKMILEYWLPYPEPQTIKGKIVKGIAKRFYLGNYDKDKFNVKHIENRISELRAAYGGHSLTWSLDIEAGELLKKRDKYNYQQEQLQRNIINDGIRSYFESNCPSIKHPSESISVKGAKEHARILIGYHDRIKDLNFIRDEFNQVRIEFKEKSGIKSWEEIWKKHPSIEHPKDENNYSVYDSPMGQRIMADLTEEDIRGWINKMSNSLGTQKKFKEAFSSVWANAKHKSLVGKNKQGYVPPNPTSEIKIERPKQSQFSKYDTAEFTQEETNLIFHACNELRNLYPFQTQLIKLMMFTGRRRETLLQLKHSNITLKKMVVEEEGAVFEVEGVIEIPAAINKTKRPDRIWITKNVKETLMDLYKQREEHHWSMFIDWCFPSPRVKDKEFLRVGNENNTQKARLKDVVELWKSIKDIVSRELEKDNKVMRPIAMKMFRNTYENKVNESKQVRSTWDIITVTGRADTESAEKNYLNKKLTSTVANIVNDVDAEFTKIISISGKK